MAVNLKKFITNNLPEFLLLALEPNAVFAIDTINQLKSVIVCYDVQYFYKNYKVTASKPVELVSLDEFILYCESKIQSEFVVKLIDYQCCMTVSDLIRMEAWACLYDNVGPYVMKYLLFNCLLFVPLQENVYYCINTPSQKSDRYEVLQSFRTKAGRRWNSKKKDNYLMNNLVKTNSTCFNIAGLLKNIKTICQSDADNMLKEILQTYYSRDSKADYDETCFIALKCKLQIMSNNDSLETYKDIYKKMTGDFVQAEIPLGRIKKFSTTIVCKIVPRELFGVSSNRDQYCENLCKILNGGKFHNFSVHHIMHKIKVKKIKWLNCVDANRRTDIITKTLVWLTNVFVFGRIAYFFRVVTTNTPNNGIAYFAKSKWATMCHEKISPLMRGGEFFKELRPNPENSVPPGPLPSSYRNWKVCPYAKPNGVRLIFKLLQKENGTEKQLMDNCLTFLRCLSRTYPAEFRSVTRPQFFRDWTAMQASRGHRDSPVYYVRTDFRDAFTSFVQDKLQSVVRDRIVASFGKKSQMLNVYTVDVVKVGGAGTVFCKKRKFINGLPEPDFPGGSLVFYDKTTVVPLTLIWNAVRNCVRCNAVERGGRRWAVTRGIVQGDRLSVVLCDLLLADLQETRLNGSIPRGRLYRFVDDYVFVSYDRAAALRFLAIMSAGFDDYGLRLNRSKTVTNLDGQGDGVVKFLGFRLNTITGEVSKDEGAFRNRQPLHFFYHDPGRCGNFGRALYVKMTGPSQHPVPAILVSKSFNSIATVVRNLASIVAYKAFAVAATVRQYFFHLNPAFLLKITHAIARLMYAKVCGLIRHSAVTPMQCKWIVYEVYVRMFRRHLPGNDGRIDWTVDRLRNSQSTVGRKCNTRQLKTALKHYDFTKMFS